MAYMTTDYSTLVGRTAVQYFLDGLLSNPPDMLELFDQQFTNNLDEKILALRGLGMFSARSTEDAEPTALTGGGEGDSVTVSLVEYLCKVSFTDAVYRRLDPSVLAEIVAEMGRSAAYTIAHYVQAIIANGFSTTLCGDGLSLYNDSHTDQVGGTYETQGSASRSHSALSAAIAAASVHPSSEGLSRGAELRFLWVPPELEYTARQILGSSVTSSSMQANPLQNSLTIMVNKLATAANDWGLASEPFSGGKTLFYGLQPKQREYHDDTNENLVHTYTMQFEIGGGVNSPKGDWGASVS